MFLLPFIFCSILCKALELQFSKKWLLLVSDVGEALLCSGVCKCSTTVHHAIIPTSHDSSLFYSPSFLSLWMKPNFYLWQTPRRSPQNQSRKLVEWAWFMFSLSQQCDATANHFGVCMLSNQHLKKKKKELPVCSGDWSWWPRGNQMTLFSGERKDYVWLPEDSQGILSRSMTHSKKWRENDGNTKMAAPVRKGGLFHFSR